MYMHTAQRVCPENISAFGFTLTYFGLIVSVVDCCDWFAHILQGSFAGTQCNTKILVYVIFLDVMVHQVNSLVAGRCSSILNV